jgi:hypothetical protein
MQCKLFRSDYTNVELFTLRNSAVGGHLKKLLKALHAVVANCQLAATITHVTK